MRTPDPGALLPRDWDSLAPLVDQLLDAPSDQRAALLGKLSAGDPTRRAELERLVAECERQFPLLDRPAIERFDQLVGADPAPPPPGMLGDRYRIERELGSGGMARVYLAQDLKHSRHVAVKVIRPELAASLGRDRFLREIAIAARLRHPSIMPLYDSGDSNGDLYFVMPYEAGLSLRARLESGGELSITDGMSILRDVARALAYAHEHGVVHRDVKPDNVMLAGDAAIVTDFGIAKAVSAALTDAGGNPTTITQAGSAIGTPAYMAPEQATGDPATDHRADIYSWGCLAYEVFTGKPPFAGISTHQVIAAHLGTAARLITEIRSDVPAPVAALIARCLEKEPSARPQTASTLLDGLNLNSPLGHRPVRRRWKTSVVLAVLGVIVALGVIVGYPLTRGRPVAVAVLPMGSQGGDSVQALAAEGFSLDIAGSLVKFPWVRVMSRGGGVKFSGVRDLDVRRIGKELGARYLVYGVLSEIGGRLTVLLQLTDSETEALVWSDRFDATADLAAVKDRIVAIVADSLRPRAGGRFRRQVAPAVVVRRGNDEAYRLYLIGKTKLNQRSQSVAASIALFREAVALDTLYPEAWSGLSLALALAPRLQSLSPESFTAEATTAAQRALRLNPRLSDPHVALGMLLEYALKWDLAESEYKTALELDSHNVEARIQYGSHLRIRGRVAESLKQDQLAAEDDPVSAVVASHLAYAWFLQGQLDSALAQIIRAQQIDSTNLTTASLGGQVLLAAGRPAEARRLVENLRKFTGPVLYLLGRTGKRDSVLERLRILDTIRPTPALFHHYRVQAMLGLGDTARGLDELERAIDAKEMWFWGLISSGPIFAEVRGSPRFRALLNRVGLSLPQR